MGAVRQVLMIVFIGDTVSADIIAATITNSQLVLVAVGACGESSTCQGNKQKGR